MNSKVGSSAKSNRCAIEDAVDTTAFAAFAADGNTGIRIATERSGPDGTHALQPDAIDFVKWLKQSHQQLRIDVPAAPKRVLHSADSLQTADR
ncbi:MAG: hypothetical protein M3O61_00550 [Gemmatimonadota bacterium]|nr:hypothetical protein [Gemmatimonadota bacterium]